MAKQLILLVLLTAIASLTYGQHITGLEEVDGLYYKINGEAPFTGKAVSYHTNGEVSGRFLLVNGQLEGLQEFYDESGALVREINYKHGVADGDFIVFFEDGRRVKQRGLYSKARPYGTWVSFDKKGKIIKEEVYSAFGERVSERTF